VALRISITDVSAQGAGVWSVRLTPADVRRLGDSRSSFGCRSVLATTGAIFNDATRELSVAPGATTVLNIGATDDALVIEVGQRGDVVEAEDAEAEDTIKSYNFIESVAGHRKTLERGDAAFLAECRRLMPPDLTQAAEQLLSAVRQEFPGEVEEGLARKWVNYPRNFFAITIQPRDVSFAIHIKGHPNHFAAPSLDIKMDRSSYSRFKLSNANQLSDAIGVVMMSGRRDRAHHPRQKLM